MGDTIRKLVFDAGDNRLAWAAYKEVCRREGDGCLEKLDCGAATYELPTLSEVERANREGLSLVLFDWKGKDDGAVEAREVLEYVFSHPEKYRQFIEQNAGRRPTELTDGLGETDPDDQLAARTWDLITIIKEEVAKAPLPDVSDADRIREALAVAAAYPKLTYLIVDDSVKARLRDLHMPRLEKDLRARGGIGLEESPFIHRWLPAGEVLAKNHVGVLSEPREHLNVIEGMWEAAGVPGSFVLLLGNGGGDRARFALQGGNVCYKSATKRCAKVLVGGKLTARQYHALHLEYLGKQNLMEAGRPAKRFRIGGDAKEALRLFDLAVQMEPRHGDPLFTGAEFYLDRAARRSEFYEPLLRDPKLEEAERLVDRGLAGDPDNTLGWYTRARVEERKGSSTALVDAANRALELSESGSDLHEKALYLRAIGYEKSGRYDDALRDLGRLARRPGDWTPIGLYIDRARIWIESKIL